MEATEQKLSKKARFIIAVSGQVALLVLLVLYKLATYSSGTEVLLKLQPVDPRDLLRGDYVTIQYDITRVNSYASERIQTGDTVYVPLVKGYEGGNKFWTSYGGVTKQLPTTERNGQVYIQGIVQSGGVVPGSVRRDEFMAPSDSQLVIRYGIEDYFIPEATGRQAELNTGTAYARVAVDDDGKAIIKQLYLNDKPWPK